MLDLAHIADQDTHLIRGCSRTATSSTASRARMLPMASTSLLMIARTEIGVLARASFWHLFDNQLKSGGMYVIEDWGTGYWDKWLDGVSYSSHAKDLRPTLYCLTFFFSSRDCGSTLLSGDFPSPGRCC